MVDTAVNSVDDRVSRIPLPKSEPIQCFSMWSQEAVTVNEK